MTINLKHLRTLASEATQGERVVNRHYAFKAGSENGAAIETTEGVRIGTVTRQADKPLSQKKADADLIAAANPQTVIALLDLIDQMGVSLKEHTGLFTHGPEFERRVKALQAYEKMKGE